MNHLERVSCILGSLLIGLAASFIFLDHRARGSRPPVDELAEELKQAWAPYHTP